MTRIMYLVVFINVRTTLQVIMIDLLCYTVGRKSASVWLEISEYRPGANGNLVAFDDLILVLFRLYAVGGCGIGDEEFSLVECYDPSTERWTVCRPTPVTVSNATLASLGESLYCVHVKKSSSLRPYAFR